MRDELSEKISGAVARLVSDGRLPSAGYPPAEVSDTKSPEHGDFACNFALVAAKAAGLKPREIGELLASALSGDRDFEKVEVAGPGFVNLTLSAAATARALSSVLADPEGFYRSVPERSLKINVEYVSVNPNGPITIGSGRGAAYGSTLCNVLEAAGHTVHREYYINDGTNSEQMRLFAESVRAVLIGKGTLHYRGDYVKATAEDFSYQGRYALNRIQGYLTVNQPLPTGKRLERVEKIKRALDGWPDHKQHVADEEEARKQAESLPAEIIQECVQILMVDRQRADLAAFGVEFDTWFSEQSLHDSGAVDEEINHLVKLGVVDDREERVKVKFGKGGAIEDVEVESHASEDDEGPNTVSPEEIGKRKMTSEGDPASVHETLWLRSTKFGDDMDRVLRRRDGRLTYIASDVAYHKDKLKRPPGCDKLITVLGPDHHGYIGRLRAVFAATLMGQGQGSRVEGQEVFSASDAEVWRDAAEKAACLAALEEAKRRLEIPIFQLVRFLKDGKPAPMRKRDGNIYALIDLIDEIGEKVQPEGSLEEKRRTGRDVARFFYLMRSHDTTFDFDLDLAERQSEDNPVFYAQYAHARICGVIRKAEESGFPLSLPEEKGPGGQRLELLTHPKEKALILKLQDLGYEVARCADDYAVNRLTTYAVELARAYHHFYDACRVVQPDEPELSRARLALCHATRASLRAVFGLLGISAPERM